MRRLKLFDWAAVLAMTVALVPATASADEADTLSISGTFSMNRISGTVGDDLAEVYANDNDHVWFLTLHGVTCSYEADYEEFGTEFGDGYVWNLITRVHATSFEFEFFGPDADVLNQVVSAGLTTGGLTDDAVLQYTNVEWFDPVFVWSSLSYVIWDLDLSPPENLPGVSFSSTTLDIFDSIFQLDQDGYPLVVPQSFFAGQTAISDLRPGSDGLIDSSNERVDIGVSEPPPPPPPTPPALTIADGSVREGDRGTTWLDLTVSLSRYPDDVVMVDYQTADGTAKKKSDYTATSGTLLFWPDEISHTISIAIKADRKREADEYFTVRLSNAVGATIDDGVATATILNDD